MQASLTAAVTLLGRDLLGIVRARKLSRMTMANIRQNLVFAFAYKRWASPSPQGCSTRWSTCCCRLCWLPRP